MLPGTTTCLTRLDVTSQQGRPSLFGEWQVERVERTQGGPLSERWEGALCGKGSVVPRSLAWVLQSCEPLKVLRDELGRQR